MPKPIVYLVHPGQRHSHANRAMAEAATRLEGLSFVDLYAEYPRHDIDVSREQDRLLKHDVIVFQFPLYWYSTPSLLKEWQDLVLQHGWAYGHGGDKLNGKTLLLAVTTGGSEDAYSHDGYQNHPIRDFLRPLEQTARLCGMRFARPYVLHSALKHDKDNVLRKHASGFAHLLLALKNNEFELKIAGEQDIMTYHDFQIGVGE